MVAALIAFLVVVMIALAMVGATIAAGILGTFALSLLVVALLAQA